MIKKLSPNEIEDIKEALRTKRYFDRNNLPGNVSGWGKYVLREPTHKGNFELVETGEEKN